MKKKSMKEIKKVEEGEKEGQIDRERERETNRV